MQLRKRKEEKKESKRSEEEIELTEGLEGLALAKVENKNKGGKNESVKDVLDGLKAYTERHYGRLEKMAEERWVLDWTLRQMES